MELRIDLPWLLETQERAEVSKHLEVHDYSALEAAVTRHASTARLGHAPDPAWRAGALLHTIVALRPLPAYNQLFGCAVATQYMHQSGEGIDPPYGALVDLCREITAGADVFAVATRLRSWRI